MGKSPRAEGCSKCEREQARQTSDVSLGSSQDRSGSTCKVGEGQAGEESCLTQTRARSFSEIQSLSTAIHGDSFLLPTAGLAPHGKLQRIP